MVHISRGTTEAQELAWSPVGAGWIWKSHPSARSRGGGWCAYPTRWFPSAGLHLARGRFHGLECRLCSLLHSMHTHDLELQKGSCTESKTRSTGRKWAKPRVLAARLRYGARRRGSRSRHRGRSLQQHMRLMPINVVFNINDVGVLRQ